MARLFGRGRVVVTVVALVAAGLPGLVLAAGAGAGSAAATVTPTGSVPTSPVPARPPVELPGLRTAVSRTYATSQGMEAHVYGGAVNFRDGSGGWQPIDDTLVASAGGGWHNRANAYSVSLAASLAAGPVAVSNGGVQVSWRLSGATAAAGAASSASVTYRGALPATDVTYSAQADRVKETLVLHDASAPSQAVFAVSASPGVSASATAAGGAVFSAAGGATPVSFAPPTVTDGAGVPGPATLSLLPASGGGWTATVAVDAGWLGSPGRVWPVTVDPQAQFSGSQYPDCTLSSATPTTSSCNVSPMYVGYSSTNTQRSIIDFNTLSSVVPADAVVTNADLQVYTSSISVAGSYPVAVNAVTQGWTTSATWNTSDGSTSWPTSGPGCPSGSTCGAGGDFTTTAADTVTVSATGWHDWYPVGLVQGWVNGSVANNGLMMKEATESSTTTIGWESMQSANTPLLPDLIVTYTRPQGDQSFYTYNSRALTDHSGVKVNVGSGNLLYSSTDLHVAGIGQDATFNRYFNSLDAPDIDDAGYGWHMGFAQDHALEVNPTAVSVEGPSDFKAVFLRARGTYTSFTPPPGIDADLTSADSGATYTVTFHQSQEVWTFGNINGGIMDLLSDKDRNGNTLTFHYTCSAGCLSDYVTDSEGRQTSFSYTTGTNVYLQTITDPSSPARTASYSYTGNLLTQATDLAGGHTTYGYDSQSRINQITDPVGDITTAAYDSTGRVTTLTAVTDNVHLTGPTTAFNYDANLLTADQGSYENGTGGTSPVAPTTIAQTTAQALDGSHSLAVTMGGSDNTVQTDQGTSGVPAGPGVKYSAEASSRAATTGVSFWVDLRFFDSAGSTLATTAGSAVTDTTTGWTKAAVTATSPANTAYIAVLYRYSPTGTGDVHYLDEAGIQVGGSQTWNSGGATKLLSGCAGLRVTHVVDPLAHVATYCLDSSDRVAVALDALGRSRQGQYNPDNQPTQLTDGATQATTLNYDTNTHNLTSMVAPNSNTGSAAATQTWRYTTGSGPAGNAFLASSQTDPQGACRAFQYNDTPGNLTDVYANQNGNCDSGTGGSAHYTNAYQHDSGVSSCTSDTLTTTYPGVLCSSTDPNSRTTAYFYTFAGSAPRTLSSVQVRGPSYSCTAPRNGCEDYTFDTVGRVKTVTDSSNNNSGAGEETTYCYDSLDRVTALYDTSPSSPPTCGSGSPNVTYTYDGDGHVTQRVDATGTATFGYDTIGRLVTKSTGTTNCTVTVASGTGTGTACYSYDAANNITAQTDASGTTSYGYDAANNLTSLAEPGGSCTGTVSLCTTFAYDNNNRRTTTTYPGGATFTRGYDNAGNVTSAVGKNSSNTTVTSFVDCFADLSSGACPTTGGADRSNVTQVAETGRAAVTTDYYYDNAARLCLASPTTSTGCTSRPTGADQYSYDGAGNRSQLVTDSATTSYGYDGANRICFAGSTSGTESSATCPTTPTGDTGYSFDGQGNQTASTNPTSSFTYNTLGQTTAITDNSVTLSAIAYADVGQTERTAYTQSGTTTNLFATPLGLDKITAGTNTSYTVRDNTGALVGYKDASGVHWYYMFDGHGSVVALIKSDGTTIGNRYDYDENGKTTYTMPSPQVTQPYGYTAGINDPTGLTKFGTRYYDPNLGRWTQPDPIAGTITNPATVNKYPYAGDNPLHNVDSNGTCFLSLICGSLTLGDTAQTYVGLGIGAVGLASPFGPLAFVAGSNLGVAHLLSSSGDINLNVDITGAGPLIYFSPTNLAYNNCETGNLVC